MAETPSTMIPLGTVAPDFQLIDTRTGKPVSLSETKSKIATVVLFICNHCPYVKYIQPKLIDMIKKYQASGVSFIAINSNDAINYTADSPEEMRKQAREHEFTFPYLYDATQEIAKAYQAACTPDLYVFDGNLKCVYRGRFDNATPGNHHPVTGKDLSHALDCVLTGKKNESEQKPSIGCNIKWKK